MRKVILKLLKLSKVLDSLISDIDRYKEKDLKQELLDCYFEYLKDCNTYTRDRHIADALYDLQDRVGNYYSSIDHKLDPENKYELISEIETIANNMRDGAEKLARSHGIDFDYEEITLSDISEQLRFRLDEEFEGLVSKQEMEEKIWSRADKVEQLFFDPTRNKKPETKELSDSFFSARRTTSSPSLIDTDEVPGRRIITADTDAVGRSLAGVDPSKLKTTDGIAEQTQWQRKGPKNWNYEHVQRGKTGTDKAAKKTKKVIIKSQYQPFPANLSNFHLKGIGQYGDEASKSIPNILTVINQTTGQDKFLEMRLARLFIQFAKEGAGFSETILLSAGFKMPTAVEAKRQQIERLNRVAYLCCIKEITRRKHQGFIQESSSDEFSIIPELPFGLVIALTLRLLADGHLRMAQVFAKDAEYGVFTGDRIMAEKNIAKTIEKFKKVINLYCVVYQPKIDEGLQTDITDEGGTIFCIPFREHLHQLMQAIYGGEEDSSGAEYLSSSPSSLEDKMELSSSGDEASSSSDAKRRISH